jgi:GDPmannose 4,6-dehydratase
MAKKTALITGVTGQDGSYLAELLLERGYDVHHSADLFSEPLQNRRSAEKRVARKVFELHYGDRGDSSSLSSIISNVQPAGITTSQPRVTLAFPLCSPSRRRMSATGVLRVLEGIRSAGLNTRFCQASSSKLFDKVEEAPRLEVYRQVLGTQAQMS